MPTMAKTSERGLRDSELVERYVERVFQRSGQTGWPNVREVARALRLRQIDVSHAVEDCENLQLTYYNVAREAPLGDYYVETLNPPGLRDTKENAR